jgi:MraZ protein
MITFIGEYNVKLDDKGRVIFPSAFKSIMSRPEKEKSSEDAESETGGRNPEKGDSRDMRFVIKKDIFEDCLEMYTFEEWERQSEEVKSRLNFFNRDHAIFWREYMRNRAIVEPDAKLGRISIPRKLLDSIGVTKEVVFSGNDFKIEIWAKEKYEADMISNEKYLEIAGKLSDQR